MGIEYIPRWAADLGLPEISRRLADGSLRVYDDTIFMQVFREPGSDVSLASGDCGTMSAVKISGVSSAEGARLLGFDTEHFGTRIGMADHQDVNKWAAENAVDCLFMLLGSDEISEVERALANGWLLTDMRVELDMNTHSVLGPTGIRHADLRDLPSLVDIARTSHRITRFYADPHFSREHCDDLYEAWIRNSFAGWAQAVLVYGSRPLGYITVHVDGHEASIGLIAVTEAARGQGIGKLLCKRAIGFAYEQGAHRITTVTQARNVPALRLFESCGFRIVKTGYWLHRHFR